MGEFEDQLLTSVEETDPELAGRFKQAFEATKRDTFQAIDEAASQVEVEIRKEIKSYKEGLDMELQSAKNALAEITSMDTDDITGRIEKMKETTAALTKFLEEREERFLSFGNNLGGIVRRGFGALLGGI